MIDAAMMMCMCVCVVATTVTKVRRIFTDYYSCTDVRETKEALGVFLKEASVALELQLDLEPELDPSSSSNVGTVGSFPSSTSSSPAARLASRLKTRLLESSERLNYHLDGDQPMVLYRFWVRSVSA